MKDNFYYIDITNFMNNMHVDEISNNKTFGIPSLLLDKLIEYPNYNIDDLSDELIRKYGEEKTKYILKQLYSSLYNLKYINDLNYKHR